MLFHSSFKISAYNLSFQLEEVHRFIITFFVDNLPVFCTFPIVAGSHEGSTLKCLWKSCNYVTCLRRKLDLLHLLLPRGDAVVKNHTIIMLGFQWKYTAHTHGVCCGEREHLIGNPVSMDLELVLYCHLLLIHLPTMLTMHLRVAPGNLH